MVRRTPPHLLRVMSWNLHDLQDDRAAAARVIRAVDPDVLCLQEVPRRLTTQLRVPPFADPAGRHTTSWPPEPPTG